MAARANIYVCGSVQAVGYRAYVMNVAALMGVKGLARNLGNGSVEIFAEAGEEILKKFIKAIDVKGKPGDILSLNVERMEVWWEGDPNYTGPWRQYTHFEIDYGEEVTKPIDREMLESLELAKLYFTKLVTEFRDYREEFGDYREEFRDYREEFRKFRDESLKISRETLDEVKGVRGDLKAILNERLERIEKYIADIKARIGLT